VCVCVYLDLSQISTLQSSHFS